MFKALADGGFDVRATDRTFRRDLPGRVEVANLLDGPTCYRLLEDCQAVVHLANHPHIFVRRPFQDVYAENVAMDVNVFQAAAELGIKPLCTILDYAEVSQPPKDIATVPGLAIRKILEQNDLTLDRIDLVEINEAFAAVVLVSARSILGMTKEEMFAKVNVNGSAIAYGHPIGATGARILMTLAYELRRRGGGLGVCGICSGAAQGDAMLIRV